MPDRGGRGLVLAARIAGTLVLAAMIAPFLTAAWMSFAPGEVLEPPTGRWSIRWYREFLGSARWMEALGTSLQVALLSLAGSLIGGLGLAVAVSRFHFHGRRLLSGSILLPLFVPAVVLAMGLLPLVRITRLWGSVFALAAAHSLTCLPVVFLVLRAALEKCDPALERAARGLGAGPCLAFRRITLPLILPAVFAGCVMALILSLNEFTIALFLSTPRVRTLPAALWPEARDKETPLLAAASCLSVLATLLGLLLARSVLRLDARGSTRGTR